MVSRPKYPKNDANHTMVAEVLRKLDHRYMGIEFFLIDTSKAGGAMTDYLLIAGGKVHFVEVKVVGKEDDLTLGERETQSLGVPFYIVTTPEQVVDMLMDIAEEVSDEP